MSRSKIIIISTTFAICCILIFIFIVNPLFIREEKTNTNIPVTNTNVSSKNIKEIPLPDNVKSLYKWEYVPNITYKEYLKKTHATGHLLDNVSYAGTPRNFNGYWGYKLYSIKSGKSKNIIALETKDGFFIAEKRKK
jgi:hypothetical protein